MSWKWLRAPLRVSAVAGRRQVLQSSVISSSAISLQMVGVADRGWLGVSVQEGEPGLAFLEETRDPLDEVFAGQ